MMNKTMTSDNTYTNMTTFLDYDDIIMPELPAHLLAIFTALYVLVFLLGLTGNMAVIIVVLQCRSMRTSINLLFLNLCLADLFALVITGPTVVVDMFAKEAWYLGPFMCFLPLLSSPYISLCVGWMRVSVMWNVASPSHMSHLQQREDV